MVIDLHGSDFLELGRLSQEGIEASQGLAMSVVSLGCLYEPRDPIGEGLKAYLRPSRGSYCCAQETQAVCIEGGLVVDENGRMAILHCDMLKCEY